MRGHHSGSPVNRDTGGPDRMKMGLMEAGIRPGGKGDYELSQFPFGDDTQEAMRERERIIYRGVKP